MPNSSRWKRSAEYWKTVPPASNALLLSGIFLLFTSFGLVLTFVNRTWVYVPWAILIALVAGLYSVLWAFAGFRRIIWLIVVLFPCQFAANIFIGKLMSRHVPAFEQVDWSRAATQHRLHLEGLVCMVAIVAGYSLIAAFIRKEGLRIFTTTAEVRLATEVHRALVPVVSQRAGAFDFYGVSVPSGHVGGDLVDVSGNADNWLAYVADVSGHGVSAGMIMAMVKSAARMGSAKAAGLPALLSDLNSVLLSVSASNLFVTFACIAGTAGNRVQFALAGHLPILHYRKRLETVEERGVENLPLAILPHAEFTAAEIECEEGDVLAVLTDGLTETSDAMERELGLEPLKQTLARTSGNSLAQIAAELRKVSLQHGSQVDDQTVLLVSYCKNTH